MRTILSALVLAVTLPVAASSQSYSGIFPNPPWCSTCYVASHSDEPLAGSAVSASTVLWFWAGACGTGTAITDVTATAVVNGAAVSVDIDYVMGGQRSDIVAHLQSHGCHGGHNVVAAWFSQGIPAGATSVTVRLHSYGIYGWHLYAVQ